LQLAGEFWAPPEKRVARRHNRIVDRDGGTEVRLMHETLPSEASRDRHNEGWSSVLDRLEEFFNK